MCTAVRRANPQDRVSSPQLEGILSVLRASFRPLTARDWLGAVGRAHAGPGGRPQVRQLRAQLARAFSGCAGMYREIGYAWMANECLVRYNEWLVLSALALVW